MRLRGIVTALVITSSLTAQSAGARGPAGVHYRDDRLPVEVPVGDLVAGMTPGENSGSWVVEPGGFGRMIGSSSKDIRLRGELTVR